MTSPKYKFLVLTDFSDSCNAALESAVNLSKIINGSVEVFHILKPMDIAEYENQFSAMRSINEKRFDKKAKLKTLVREISKRTDVSINASCIIGNLKDETLKLLETINPDIVVLGKRSPKLINFLGDAFTKFILDKFEGSVLISGKENAMLPAEIISLGMFNTTADELQVAITNDLRKQVKNPIKHFYVHTDEQSPQKAETTTKNGITYEFDNGSNIMNNIANYVAKNNIGLLCINPQTEKNTGTFRSLQSNIKEVIQKINTPILIVNNKSSIQLQ